MHRNKLADASRRRGTGIGCCLDRADIAAHQDRHVPRADVFRANQRDIGRFDHRVGSLDRADESAGFHHPERISLSFHLIEVDDIMAILSMQRSAWSGGLFRSLALLVTVCSAASCARGEDNTPAVATAEVSLSRPRVAQGSPVDVTYRFNIAQPPAAAGTYRVFVHVVDADEELMWTDDHAPPSQPNEWQPGQKIEYSRTMFVPMYPYVGGAKVIVGVYDTTTNTRLKLGNTDRGDRSYAVADFELLPQTENVYLIYKDGWHPAEVAPDNPSVEWKWTRKEATLAFRNPKRDATFIVQMDNPAQSPGAASEVELRIGEQSLGTVPVGSGDAPVRKFPLTAAQLGTGDMVEIRLIANRTFVPALDSAGKSGDTRELGVRVFHAFVQPQ